MGSSAAIVRTLARPLGLFALLLCACGRDAAPPAPDPIAARLSAAPARIGAAECETCHAGAAAAWRGTKHGAGTADCEACHGAGSRHAAWVAASPDARVRVADRGLAQTFAAIRSTDWQFAANTTIAHRRTRLPHGHEAETCAHCHADGVALDASPPDGAAPLADVRRVATLQAPLFHVDGQPAAARHPYGTFLQGAMHEAGVTCGDCHEPHALALRDEGDALCTACHRDTAYAVAAHHRHPPAHDAARCVACHMPRGAGGTRDHAFRVPAPADAVDYGVPDACTGCHEDRDAAWARDTVASWSDGATARSPFARALHAAATRAPGADAELRGLIDESALPALVRASAIEAYAPFATPLDAARLRNAALDPDPLVRTAVGSAAAAAGPEGCRVLGNLIADTRRAVRIAAFEGSVRCADTGADAAARERARRESQAVVARAP